MDKIARVFPTKTSMSPTDEHAKIVKIGGVAIEGESNEPTN